MEAQEAQEEEEEEVCCADHIIMKPGQEKNCAGNERRENYMSISRRRNIDEMHRARNNIGSGGTLWYADSCEMLPLYMPLPLTQSKTRWVH